ncbi:export associated protein [Streptomyces globosus]|uniref:Export associated protein n=1 Tax=Streptomyces globosus TaxID=68209 RepID=A0A344U4U5_9ACTN|nr:TerD family protein [Streptomyces globosus]AXE25916.1 export associated protein [Streptomyces globosus]
MTAELVRGQNHPLSRTRVEIRIAADTPVLALVAACDDTGRMAGPGALAHPGAPAVLPGLAAPEEAAAAHRFAVDLDAAAPSVHQLRVVLVLPPGGPARFGSVAAPRVAVAEPGGADLACFALAGLDAEGAVVALEVYRRQGAWKVRAVGQGYADGLPALLADAGLTAPAAAALASAAAGGAAGRVGGAAAAGRDGAGITAVPAAAAGSHGLAAPQETPPAGTAAGPAAAGPAGAAPEQDGPAAVPGPVPVSGTPYAGTPGPVPAPDGAGGPPTVDYTHPRRRRSTSEPPEPAPQAPAPAAPGEAPVPVAGDAAGWTMDERLYNQVWGMFEDLARAVAAYRSACEFADSRLDRELDAALSDPRHRVAGAGHPARDAARARRDELAAQARSVLDRDLDQLAAEAAVVEPALPAAYARWASPVWHGAPAAGPDEAPMALRLGDLHLPERPDLRIPMLVRLPLERGLWIDNGRTGSEAAMAADTDRLRRAAMDMAVAHAARLLAVHPAGRYSVHVIDAAGAGAASLAPLVHAGVLAGPPAAGAAGVAETLERLTRRVDLVQMAVRAGAPEELPPDVDTAEQLLIVHDFPHGFDDRAVTRLRYLADEGPAVGVHLLMVADRDEAAAYGPLLDPLWRRLMRLTPVPDDHLADPWVGHAWTFEPDLPPAGSLVLDQAVERAARARRHARP